MLQILVLAASAAASSGPAACAAIEDDRARLACYDALFRQAPEEQGALASASAGDPMAGEPSPPAAAVAAPSSAPVAAAASNPEADFGLSGQQRQERAEAAGARKVDEVSAKIVAIEPSRVGKPAIELDNGQRWRQIEATSWPVFEIGENVVIRKASFGSFLAVVPDSGHAAVRVKREE
jgi:hypothetical protein